MMTKMDDGDMKTKKGDWGVQKRGVRSEEAKMKREGLQGYNVCDCKRI